MNLRGLFQDFNPRWGAADSALGRLSGLCCSRRPGTCTPGRPREPPRGWERLQNVWSRRRPASFSRAWYLQFSGPRCCLEPPGQGPPPGPREPVSSWCALPHYCPNFPLSIPASYMPLPVIHSPRQGYFACTQLPPTAAVSSTSSQPLRFSLEVSPSLPCLLLCQTDIWNVGSLESVSGYGNTLHNAFGDEPDNFPYAFSHVFTVSSFAGSSYCCSISRLGNIHWTVWREYWLRNHASVLALAQMFCDCFVPQAVSSLKQRPSPVHLTISSTSHHVWQIVDTYEIFGELTWANRPGLETRSYIIRRFSAYLKNKIWPNWSLNSITLLRVY